jgi:hypothetical protein
MAKTPMVESSVATKEVIPPKREPSTRGTMSRAAFRQLKSMRRLLRSLGKR